MTPETPTMRSPELPCQRYSLTSSWDKNGNIVAGMRPNQFGHWIKYEAPTDSPAPHDRQAEAALAPETIKERKMRHVSAEAMTETEKANLAIDLIRRGLSEVEKWPARLCRDEYPSRLGESMRWQKAKEVLDDFANLMDEHGPDPEWYRDFCLLSGDHYQLTEEGWEPALDLAGSGDDPPEIMDEVNVPAEARRIVATDDKGGE